MLQYLFYSFWKKSDYKSYFFTFCATYNKKAAIINSALLSKNLRKHSIQEIRVSSKIHWGQDFSWPLCRSSASSGQQTQETNTTLMSLVKIKVQKRSKLYSWVPFKPVDLLRICNSIFSQLHHHQRALPDGLFIALATGQEVQILMLEVRVIND